MPSLRRLALALAVAVVSVEATEFGKECYSNSDCADGAWCVAGDSASAVQRCVAGTPCGGSVLGVCPGDETSGQLACIWREDAKTCAASPSGCATIDDKLGIYKCISLDRCDEYFDGECSGSCNVNGKQCNGRGTCLLTDKSTAAAPAFACACDSGWNGTRCDNVVDDTCVIDAGQCGAHGTCVKNACKCSNGYTGDQCQIPPKTLSSSGSGSMDSSKSSTSPVPSPSSTSSPNSSASRNSNNEVVASKKSGGGPSALVIIMAVLVALIVVGVIAFIFVARKRRREQEAANAGNFNRTDSVVGAGVEGDRPPTPKQKIVIM